MGIQHGKKTQGQKSLRNCSINKIKQVFLTYKKIWYEVFLQLIGTQSPVLEEQLKELVLCALKHGIETLVFDR